jgi:hypothetical protein
MVLRYQFTQLSSNTAEIKEVGKVLGKVPQITYCAYVLLSTMFTLSVIDIALDTILGILYYYGKSNLEHVISE